MSTTTQSTKLAGIPVDAPIGGVEDAIAQAAALTAIADVVTARLAGLKAYVGRELARPGAKVELDGYGVAMMTTPTKRAEIIDDDAFRAWALVERPDAVDTVERLETSVLEACLRGDHGDELRDRLVALCDELPGALVTDVVISAKLPEDERKAGTEHREDDGTVVIVTEDGELVPGLEVRKASTPTPRLTPDKALVERLAGEIIERLAPLPAPTEES